MVLNEIDKMITSGNPNYITESTALPTATSADALALYLQDMSTGGRPLAFTLNKYRQAMAKLAQGERWPTEADRNMYNTDGFLTSYAGMEILGYSGQRKTPMVLWLFPTSECSVLPTRLGMR